MCSDFRGVPQPEWLSVDELVDGKMKNYKQNLPTVPVDLLLVETSWNINTSMTSKRIFCA